MHAETAHLAANLSRNRERTGNKPAIACGYLNPWAAPTNDELSLARRLMEERARSQGLVLGSVFIEDIPEHPTLALQLLLQLAADSPLAAVIAPSLESLARHPRARDEIRKKLKVEAGLNLITALPNAGTTAGTPLRLRRTRPLTQRTGPMRRES